MIAGGESGAKSRPTDPRWVQSLRDQCVKHGVAFHFKQWGHWVPYAPPEGKRARQIAISNDLDTTRLWAVGKRAAGRILDGRTWDEVPSTES